VTQKLLATCVAAAAIAGSGAAAITAGISITASASPAVRPVVFGAPLPLDPVTDVAVDVPTTDQITGVLNGLADPGVSFANKAYLVEGGIGRIEARTADALMKNAVAKGQIPLSFSVGNITPTGPGAASATVTAAGPGMAPTTQTVTFVDQGGWKLSRASASTVMSIFSA
jgi:hypothetical protein